jgi:hypothetical protein
LLKVLICREVDDYPGKVPIDVIGSAASNAKAFDLIDEQLLIFRSSELILRLGFYKVFVLKFRPKWFHEIDPKNRVTRLGEFSPNG